MNFQPYNRFIAIFAALLLAASLGACQRGSTTTDGPEAAPNTTNPTGGGPAGAGEEGRGNVTTSDPTTAPETITDPAADPTTDPTGGGPTGVDELDQNLDEPDIGILQNQPDVSPLP